MDMNLKIFLAISFAAHTMACPPGYKQTTAGVEYDLSGATSAPNWQTKVNTAEYLSQSSCNSYAPGVIWGDAMTACILTINKHPSYSHVYVKWGNSHAAGLVYLKKCGTTIREIGAKTIATNFDKLSIGESLTISETASILDSNIVVKYFNMDDCQACPANTYSEGGKSTACTACTDSRSTDDTVPATSES